MKHTTITILSILFLLITGCSTSSDQKSESNEKKIIQNMGDPIVAFDNEPELRIDEYFIDPDTAKSANKRFYERHRMKFRQSGDNENIPRPDQNEIKMQALKKLYEDIRQRPNVDRTVNGIEILYGISNRKKLTTYYKTWYLDSLIETKDSISGIVRRDDTIYKYNPVEIEFVAAKEPDLNDTTMYKNWIRIKNKRNTDSDPGKPDWLTKEKNDPRSILFSFQELFLLYHRNHPGCWIEGQGPADSCSYDGFIEQRASTKWDASRNEHSMMFKYGTDDKFNYPPEGTVGNLAHICPPNCSEITYP